MDSLLMLINSRLGFLPNSEREIAKYILTHREEVMHQTVADIAKATGSSSSAVIRLCKSLNIPGFSDLKIMLARDVFADNSNIESGKESTPPIISNTIYSSIESLKDMITTLDYNSLEKAVKVIETSSYINIFGIGQSNNIAIDFTHKLERLGFCCNTQQSFQSQAMIANNMTPSMSAIIISHSGNTKEICKFAELLHKHDVPVIALTSNPSGKLLKIADIILMSSLSEPILRNGASSSRMAQLAIIDIIFNMIVKKDPIKYSLKLKETSKAYEI